MHQLVGLLERLTCGDEIRQVLDVSELLSRHLSPRDAIPDCPVIRTTSDELRLGNIRQRKMKELAYRDDLAPPALLM
jgi:hypothetical protein